MRAESESSQRKKERNFFFFQCTVDEGKLTFRKLREVRKQSHFQDTDQSCENETF